MSYEPSPIDTSQVRLSAEEEQLVEVLARNAHEVWARERISAGWAPGPAKDDEARTTPLLVPYDDLAESEKDIDRAMVREALKASRARGWRLLSPATANLSAAEAEQVTAWDAFLAAEAQRGERRRTFDMDDRPELDSGFLDPAGALQRALRFLQERVARPWAAYDVKATRQQRRHCVAARVAIAAGTLAILFSIVSLVSGDAGGLVAFGQVGEALAVGMAFVAVLAGTVLGFHHGWLASRQVAERLRILKFESLSWPELFVAPDEWEARVERAVETLERVGAHEAAAWCERDAPPAFDETPDLEGAHDKELLQLRAYYKHKRLVHQAAYFERRARDLDYSRWPERVHLPVYLFLAGVVCVIAHWIWHRQELLFGASFFPILGFGIRAWLTATENPRQASMFRAKAAAMVEAQDQLRLPDAPVEEVLTRIIEDERFFESEHREWCRLQFAAEWFL